MVNDILARLKLCIIVFYFSFLTKWIKWFYLLCFWFLSLYNLAWQWHGIYFLTGHVGEWHGMTWLDMTCYDSTWHVMTWHKMTCHMGILGIKLSIFSIWKQSWHDMAWDFLTGQKVIWLGITWYVMTGHDMT